MVLAIVALGAGVSNWVAAVEHPAGIPAAAREPRVLEPIVLDGPGAERIRRDLLRRAALETAPSPGGPAIETAPAPTEISSCRFVQDKPSGTTPKFTCVLPNGEVVKVKYGRHPEIHAEVAASQLLRLLGYPADTVLMVAHLRCEGCPRYPFSGSYVLANAVTRRLLARPPDATGYTDFTWVSMERRFPARAIETASVKGWHWWELEEVGDRARTAARRAEIDALKLLAAFLAHWDNKSENQRLVCLDRDMDASCGRPLALVQDLGATFGPMKVNLARWRELPVWDDRHRCSLSMRNLPYGGASFADTTVSEAGRARLAARLAALPDDDVRNLFAYARFPEYHSGTHDRKDLDAWTTAFRHRANQIVELRCPA
jgi:hypothetical protein